MKPFPALSIMIGALDFGSVRFTRAAISPNCADLYGSSKPGKRSFGRFSRPLLEVFFQTSFRYDLKVKSLAVAEIFRYCKGFRLSYSYFCLLDQKYKRGLLRNYFITDEWNTHSQWEKCKLGVYCSKIGSGKTPRGGSSVYTDHGVMFLRSQNVLWGSLDISDVSYIDEATNKTMLSSEVRCKDVLLNITGASIGRSCIYLLNDRANVNQHVCIIRLSQEGKERLLPEFLLQQILSDHIQQQIIDCQNGGSREGLNFQQIADFNIVLPSIKEQQVICGILNSFDQKALCEEAFLNCLHTLRVSLMQQLFI